MVMLSATTCRFTFTWNGANGVQNRKCWGLTTQPQTITINHMTYEESISVRIDRKQYRMLARRKGETGIPIAEQLRRAIAEYLDYCEYYPEEELPVSGRGQSSASGESEKEVLTEEADG